MFYEDTGQCEGEAMLHLEDGAREGLGILGGVFGSSPNKLYVNYKYADFKLVLPLVFPLTSSSFPLIFILPAMFKQPSLLPAFPSISLSHPW